MVDIIMVFQTYVERSSNLGHWLVFEVFWDECLKNNKKNGLVVMLYTTVAEIIVRVYRLDIFICIWNKEKRLSITWA